MWAPAFESEFAEIGVEEAGPDDPAGLRGVGVRHRGLGSDGTREREPGTPSGSLLATPSGSVLTQTVRG
jgi:hypothetical protein